MEELSPEKAGSGGAKLVKFSKSRASSPGMKKTLNSAENLPYA
jgi:hypothetical protein